MTPWRPQALPAPNRETSALHGQREDSALLLRFCISSWTPAPPREAPLKVGRCQSPRQGTRAPGEGWEGHSRFDVEVTKLLVDPDVAVPALQPGHGPLILAAGRPVFPVTGRRGYLLALRDGSGARARECHRGAERGTGRVRTEARTPRRRPGHSPLRSHTSAAPGSHRPLHIKSSGQGSCAGDGVDSLSVWKLQELSPHTRDQLCGSPAALRGDGTAVQGVQA